jgi:carboxyl-terminal processing protease
LPFFSSANPKIHSYRFSCKHRFDTLPYRPLAQVFQHQRLLFELLRQLHEYPFGDWKGIDWQGLNAEFRPRIAEAEANNHIKAYYLALRQYTYSFPDGHVSLVGDDLGLKAEQVGGGYGLAIAGLDDRRVIAHLVLADGPAAKAGLEVGAEILEWNGQPIEPALSQVKILWSDNPPATNEGLRLQQYRFLVRAPVGAEATIVFQNPASASPVTVTGEALAGF